LQREGATEARATPLPEMASREALEVEAVIEVLAAAVSLERVTPEVAKPTLGAPMAALAAAVLGLLAGVGTAQRGVMASHHPSRERPLLALAVAAVEMKTDPPEQGVVVAEARAVEMLRVPLERQTQAAVVAVAAVEVRAEMAETAVLA
jgi:hypothetical protein